MGAALFVIGILATIGTFINPLLSTTRSQAWLSWIGQMMGAGAALTLRKMFAPEWIEPNWAHGMPWIAISWILVLLGVVVAFRKPKAQASVV